MSKGIEKSIRIDSDEIGKRLKYSFDGLNLLVEIKGVRKIFGRKEWQVAVAGLPDSGQVWIYAQPNAKFIS